MRAFLLLALAGCAVAPPNAPPERRAVEIEINLAELHAAAERAIHGRIVPGPIRGRWTIEEFVDGLPRVERTGNHSITFPAGPLIVGAIIVLNDE